MARKPCGLSIRHLHTLYSVGAVGGRTDGELLEMFQARRGEEAAEAAFAAIVERHGPMVHRVCRQVLGNPHDSDDAFQATFLILIHKASLLNLGDSLGPWLHGVALRVASCARTARARRRTHEQRAGEERMQSAAEGDWDDLGTMLHEEIHRLPERYRAPVVLCWLEGLSTEAAGQRLRCPQGTIFSRLSRARERLRKRLARRGVTLAGGLLGPAFFTEAGSAAVEKALIGSTIQSACCAVSRNGAGVVSAEVATLTKQVLTTMLFTKAKITAAALLSVGTLIAGAGVIAQQQPAAVSTGRVEFKDRISPRAPNETPLALEPNKTQPSGDPEETAARPDQVDRAFDFAADQFIAQVQLATNLLGHVLQLATSLPGRVQSPDHEKLAARIRDDLDRVESALKKAKKGIGGPLEPGPVPEQSPRASDDNDPNSSPAGLPTDLSSVSTQPSGDFAGKRQSRIDTTQPTARAGRYIFTASPTGNRAIAYDPTTREMKSVQLNATKEHPIRITPITAPDNQPVALVALGLRGSKITRLAVFDLKSGRWLPIDLKEPVDGDVQPRYVGHGGAAYDLGPNVYTFSLPSGTWDHLDIRSIRDDVDSPSSDKVSRTGKTSE